MTDNRIPMPTFEEAVAGLLEVVSSWESPGRAKPTKRCGLQLNHPSRRLSRPSPTRRHPMADHISEEDSVLTRAIRDMTNNPWQANHEALGFPTPAQAYNAQRLEWMKLLDEVEPWALPIFVENYPARTDEGYGITSATPPPEPVQIPPGYALEGQLVPLDQVVVQAPNDVITKREDILRAANRLIHGDREQDYGRPIDSFRRVAAAFNLVLEGAGHPPIDPVTAAKLMIALKLSRLAGGDNKDDTWIDLAGYSALGAEVRDQQ